MCTARDRAAVFNLEYGILAKELLENRKACNEENMQGIKRGLLEETLLLAYGQEGDSSAEELKAGYRQFYSPDTEWFGSPDDNLMLEMISGSRDERLVIRETFEVEQCRIKRYLPVATALLLMNGSAALSSEEYKIVQNASFWIYGLNRLSDPGMEQKMNDKGIGIKDLLTEKEQKSVADVSEMGGLVLDKFYEILKKLFSQYVRKRKTELEHEIEFLKKQNVATGLKEKAPEKEPGKES